MRRRAMSLLCAAGLVGVSSSVHAEPRLTGGKLMVLVHAESCDFAKLETRLARVGKAMARYARTTQVIVDWPADPARNLDLMGRPSPIIAALEVSADPAALDSVAGKVRRKLRSVCPWDGYVVDERRLSSTERSWPLGEASPQAKVLVTLVRNSDVTREQFLHEWTEVHPGIALAWRRARGWAGHYVQDVVLGSLDGAPPLDGIGEVEGKTDGPVSDAESKARADSAAHAQTFQDLKNSAMFTAREVILKD